ncbi:TetR/AcrR family transcriptional regulator [Nocardiopsis composta]|uniref:AcrR family transcriptional regulator n=1 Tax=Nocardiopsis composta TaxID=157465 RepID=A0A7W8QPV1_9ACTN|nr:TetR family transcriptional regulator [Nocardiopsis composta]MBB5433994.1 AcrR family transcriptional regulator [Nocardiopsis composta]
MSGRRAPAPDERKRDAERSRRLILRAALGEFSRHGFQGARVARIAAEAGVNAQLISYYFGGKQGLFDAVGAAWLRAEERIDDAERPFPEVVADYVPADEERRDFARLLALRGIRGEPSDDQLAGMRHALDDIRRRQEAGELDPGLDPGCLLLLLVSAASAPAVYPDTAAIAASSDSGPDAFAERYAAFMSDLVRRLAPEGRQDRAP